MRHTYSAQTILLGGRHGSLILKQGLQRNEPRLKQLVRISTTPASRSRPVLTSFGLFRYAPPRLPFPSLSLSLTNQPQFQSLITSSSLTPTLYIITPQNNIALHVCPLIFHLCLFPDTYVQILRENNFKQTIPSVKIEDGEEITYQKVTSTVRRGAHHLAALQTSDGHWPAQIAGPLFFLPPLVSHSISIIIIYQTDLINYTLFYHLLNK